MSPAATLSFTERSAIGRGAGRDQAPVPGRGPRPCPWCSSSRWTAARRLTELAALGKRLYAGAPARPGGRRLDALPASQGDARGGGHAGRRGARPRRPHSGGAGTGTATPRRRAVPHPAGRRGDHAGGVAARVAGPTGRAGPTPRGVDGATGANRKGGEPSFRPWARTLSSTGRTFRISGGAQRRPRIR
jgi:hypothetical protein